MDAKGIRRMTVAVASIDNMAMGFLPTRSVRAPLGAVIRRDARFTAESSMPAFHLVAPRLSKAKIGMAV